MAGNHKQVGHEERDVNIRAITKFGIGLSITIIASLFILWGLFSFFNKRIEAEFPVKPEERNQPVEVKVPPQPRLQSNPRTDLRAVRESEDQLIHHYSWIDKDKGVVRIPVERAMEILAQRGLPARAQTGVTK
jgi:hypothetical protein